MLDILDKEINEISTEDLSIDIGYYWSNSEIMLDNIRIISFIFLSYLENENYIAKSPVLRINKIKTTWSYLINLKGK